jgi:hypothetical protein
MLWNKPKFMLHLFDIKGKQLFHNWLLADKLGAALLEIRVDPALNDIFWAITKKKRNGGIDVIYGDNTRMTSQWRSHQEGAISRTSAIHTRVYCDAARNKPSSRNFA